MWTTIKQYFSNITNICLLPSILLQRLVSYLAMIPGSPSYTCRMKEYRSNGLSYRVLNVELNQTAKYRLHLQSKYERYKEYLREGQSSGKYQWFCTYTSRGNRLFCLLMAHTLGEEPKCSKYTIVYSHSNASDLGIIIGSLQRLSERCHSDLFAYDYSGYGLSTGKASERNLYADIEAVVKTLIYIYKIDPKLMILFGESIGSVPTIDMAARMTFGGVILQCPLMSGIRVVYNYRGPTLAFDPFPNIEKVDKIECPVLIIHGQNDSLIDVEQGISLYKRCAFKSKPFFVPKANHNDIRLFSGYYERINEFMEEIEYSSESQ